jgi:hypothetical protein
MDSAGRTAEWAVEGAAVGVPVAFSTDDPGHVNADLVRECRRSADVLGLFTGELGRHTDCDDADQFAPPPCSQVTEQQTDHAGGLLAD